MWVELLGAVGSRCDDVVSYQPSTLRPTDYACETIARILAARTRDVFVACGATLLLHSPRVCLPARA